jgi:hypothetical protein
MAEDVPDDDFGRSLEAGMSLPSGEEHAAGGLSWAEQRDRKAQRELQRFARHWKTWYVHGGGYLSPGTTWCAHPEPELACATQQELVAAISGALTGNPVLTVLTRAAGRPAVPDEPFQPIPPRPSLTLLDTERGKLAGLHPAWHVWYGLRQLEKVSLAVTWHARPHPTISGATSPGDLGARIDQVMTSAYLSATEGEAACWRPRDSSAMRG